MIFVADQLQDPGCTTPVRRHGHREEHEHMAQNIGEFRIASSQIHWLLDAWTKIEWHIVIYVCNLQSINKHHNLAGAFIKCA
jgi:hypothetical protein